MDAVSAVAALLAVGAFAFGVAHHRGFATSLVELPPGAAPFVGLALPWLVGGAAVAAVGAGLALPAEGEPHLLGYVLVGAGALTTLTGVVCCFWVPPPLRPRWLREKYEDPAFLERHGYPRAARRARERRLQRARELQARELRAGGSAAPGAGDGPPTRGR